MDNVLQDMVQRLRAIELLLRKQNELLTRVLAEPEPNRRRAGASKVDDVRLRLLNRTTSLIGGRTKRQVLRFFSEGDAHNEDQSKLATGAG